MVPAAAYGLIPTVVQYRLGPIFAPEMPVIVVRHPPKTDSHNNPKKAIANGFIPYTARARKKKRRAVDGTATE